MFGITKKDVEQLKRIHDRHICSYCELKIEVHQSRVMEHHVGTGELRTVHRKCRDAVSMEMIDDL